MIDCIWPLGGIWVKLGMLVVFGYIWVWLGMFGYMVVAGGGMGREI